GTGAVFETLQASLGSAFDLVHAGAHALFGGGMAEAQGGNFWDGFITSGIGALAGSLSQNSPLGAIDGPGGSAARSIFSGAAGGTASLLTGGKFLNGFVTAAFAHMWNAELHMKLDQSKVTTLYCDDCIGSIRTWHVFTGDGRCTNDPACVADVNAGPIPPGEYHIVARQSGGTLGGIRDWFRSWYNDRREWFSLISTKTNSDSLIINGVQRGGFRLHPGGLVRAVLPYARDLTS
ncbi:MAG: tlde1 domain-containing protein, partial [Parvibaculaceae bacterium]